MKQFSYIFPNGNLYRVPQGSCHIDIVKAFLRGLRNSQDESILQSFSELNRILSLYYYSHYSINFDDFAIFTLGWIKITSHYKTTFCFAGYDFQYSLISKMYIPNAILDEVKNTANYPIRILNLDYDKIIIDGMHS